jgi:hypothetical protein
MLSKFQAYLRHDDIDPEVREYWKNSGLRVLFYLKNGVKSSTSTVLIATGVGGIWEIATHNPVMAKWGVGAIDLSIFSLILGLAIIWIIDWFCEHKKQEHIQEQRKKEQETQYKLYQYEDRIKQIEKEKQDLETKLECKIGRNEKEINDLANIVAKENIEDLIASKQKEFLREELEDLRYTETPKPVSTNKIKESIKNTNNKFLEDLAD